MTPEEWAEEAYRRYRGIQQGGETYYRRVSVEEAKQMLAQIIREAIEDSYKTILPKDSV